MKLVIQTHTDRSPSLLMVPESDCERDYLGALKTRALQLGLDHWDSDTNGWRNWTKTDEWGFNLVLVKDPEAHKWQASMAPVTAISTAQST